jgi:hypothetical protein
MTTETESFVAACTKRWCEKLRPTDFWISRTLQQLRARER